MKNLFNTLLLTAIIIFTANNLFAQQGIRFIEAEMDSLRKLAKAEDKLIFIKASAVWCAPCKWMEENVFTNNTVAEYYNEYFVSAEVDIDKNWGELLRYKYDIYKVPAFLFFNQRGKLIHRSADAKDTKQFIEVGKNALNPETRFEVWEKKYRKGNREPEFLRDYLKQRDEAGLPTSEYVAWYFATQQEDALLTAENFEIIELFVKSFNHPLSDYFYANKDKYAELVGKERADSKLASLFRRQIRYTAGIEIVEGVRTLVVWDDKFEELIQMIDTSGIEKAKMINLEAHMDYYNWKGKWDKYAETVIEYAETYFMNDRFMLNDLAWQFYRYKEIQDTVHLSKAIEWAEKSIELEQKYYNTDTYAALLYKTGKLKEAELQAEKTIELAKEEGEDYSTTEKLLEKIREAENDNSK